MPMEFEFGVLFALFTLFLWGGGDFLIQRTTRQIGNWETVFLIGLFGTILLTPFVYRDVIRYLSAASIIAVLAVASIFGLVASLFDFESLKKGKIAAVEPILALEIPTVAVLSLIFLKEVLSLLELFLIAVIIIGLVLVSLRERNFKLLRSKGLEKGVILMTIAAILMGGTAFFVGYGSRITNPLFVNWFVAIIATVFMAAYLFFKGTLPRLVKNVLKSPKLVFTTCLFDNLAWISFAAAVLFIPITIAMTLSENFIAVAVLLGLIVNREMLRLHQKIGFVLALAGTVVLCLFI
jgi:drug/metabolite transporter (DMT)-like permease